MKEVTLHLGDCLDVMRGMADKSVDCVITDPPYGIGEAAGKNKSRSFLAAAKDYGHKEWDNRPPSPEYFQEMKRISKHQIIFGGNYFAEWLGNSPSWIIWDKDNGSTDFADCELAWTSHKTAVRKVTYRWRGMLQEPGQVKEIRVHPTQKPVGVMAWIIERYTKPGDMIADPFMGVASTGVAAVRMGRKFIGIELDPEYYAIAEKRIQAEIDRFGLFDGVGDKLMDSPNNKE